MPAGDDTAQFVVVMDGNTALVEAVGMLVGCKVGIVKMAIPSY